MSVPDRLAQMTPAELQKLGARAAQDRQASPEVKVRLGEHMTREVQRRAARN